MLARDAASITSLASSGPWLFCRSPARFARDLYFGRRSRRRPSAL